MRPESRLDLAGELESRFLSTSQTEENPETMTNPWAGPGGTTLTTMSLGTPMVVQLSDDAIIDEVTSERDLEASSAVITPSSTASKQKPLAEVSLEHEHMARQLRQLAQELKRSKSEAAVNRALNGSPTEAATWSSEELRLVSLAISRWKRLRWHSMARQIMNLAGELKEANIVA
jgi:kinesin family protein 1